VPACRPESLLADPPVVTAPRCCRHSSFAARCNSHPGDLRGARKLPICYAYLLPPLQLLRCRRRSYLATAAAALCCKCYCCGSYLSPRILRCRHRSSFAATTVAHSLRLPWLLHFSRHGPSMTPPQLLCCHCHRSFAAAAVVHSLLQQPQRLGCRHRSSFTATSVAPWRSPPWCRH
jgi:hypothetical protein